jgi:hypothetical protein
MAKGAAVLRQTQLTEECGRQSEPVLSSVGQLTSAVWDHGRHGKHELG